MTNQRVEIWADLLDPRDPEHQHVVIIQVKEDGDYWSMQFHDGWWFSILKSHGVEPKTGDVARTYGLGIGSTIRGIEIGEKTVYYRTVEEEKERHRQWVAEKEAKEKAEYEANAEKYRERVAALPEVFRTRIARFVMNNPEFSWRYLGYELSSCEDAVKIADVLKTGDAIVEFQKMDYEHQMERVPGLCDGHSGNTFGWAVRLAHHFVTNPDLVWADHAAISPLVGCDDAGCPPLTESQMPASLRTDAK